MLNTFRTSNLLTGVSVLTLAGIVAFTNPAIALTDEETRYSSLPELEYPMTPISGEKKEVNYFGNENTSEMEQTVSEEFGPTSELYEEHKETVEQEKYSSVTRGWVKGVKEWFSDLKS